MVAAISLMAIIAAAAMALDLGKIYLAKSLDQRIADQSAVAAAFAYAQSNSSTIAQNAASSIATANSAGTATVVASIVTSPSGNGSKAAKVVVTSTVPLSPFGKVISAVGIVSVAVGASSYAEISTASSSCVTALASGGISANGGASITATGCDLVSNGSITATGGASITAAAMYAVSTISATDATIATSPTAGQTHPNSTAQSDPFGSSNVFSRMSAVAALTEPGLSLGIAPSGGGSLTCSTGTLAVPAATYSWIYVNAGCSGVTFAAGTTKLSGGLSLSNTTATITFNAGTYDIDSIYVAATSSTTATFDVNGTVVFKIWNGISLTDCANLVVNGPATYNVEGGITANSCNAMKFTNSSGSGISIFWVAGGITIDEGSATFPDGSYTIGNTSGYGIYVGGSAVATFGDGSFIISGDTGGITVEGGGKLTIGSALDSGSVFEITGVDHSYDDAIYTSGGSTLTIGSFTSFDINGPISLSSSASFGAGIYTINGALNACASGGGTLTGTGVSMIASGAICFGQGFSSINLTAPTAINGSTAGTTSTIALASESATASEINSGATHTYVTGAVYFPNAALTLDGAGNLSGNGNCLQIIANSLSFSAGSGASTNCSGLGGGSSSGAVTIVQ